MRKLYLLAITIGFLVFCNLSFAQNSTLKGVLYDETSGESAKYATIHIQGTSLGALSDDNGGFIIDNIPAGKQIVSISLFGYNPIIDTIQFTGKTITKRYGLIPAKSQLDKVEISVEGQRRVQETRTSVISIAPKDMAKMPSIGGQPDFAQYLQILPGIVSTGDQGGQLYVRGGTPIQNMLLMDGMLIYNPFHSIGLFSVFDTEIISSADIYTGGYNAEFGGRISSIMNIKTRDGNKKRIAGKLDLNPFGAKALLEGPIIKLKDDRKTALSFILSAKGSFLEQSSKIFYPYVGEQGLPYNYLDFYGKLSLTTQMGTKLNLFGFNFDDEVDFPSITRYKWNNWGLGTNFIIIPGEVPCSIEGAISYSKYQSQMGDYNFVYNLDPTDSSLAKKSSLNGFLVTLNFNYYIKKSILKVGFDVTGYLANYSYAAKSGTIINQNDYTTDIALFAKYKYNFRDKLIIEPGFRMQYYASLSCSSPEPRISFKYNINKDFRVKLAAGLYSQNFITVTSDRDVVSLFTGFLSSPDGLSRTFDGKNMRNTLQKAQHIILGFECDLIKYTTINIEGYYKNFSQLTSLNRYKILEEASDYIWEKGNAFGGDLTLKFDYKNFYFWGVYSLGWVNRFDGKVHYKPHFDRRHNLNIMISYAWGKKERKTWQADIRWNYGSGFPYTQTQVAYPHLTGGNSIGGDIIGENEEIYFLLDELNKGQLPDYHRLDLSIKKKFYIGERNLIELSGSVTNVYNYKNIFYVDRVTNGKIYQLPLLYSVGFSWSF